MLSSTHLSDTCYRASASFVASLTLICPILLNILASQTYFAAVQIVNSVKLERKEVDDVLGGPDAWKNVQKTDGEF